MKKIVLIISLITSMFAQMALARTPAPPIISSELLKFDVGHGYMKNANQGSVQVNFDSKTIMLTVMDKAKCPPDAYCILGFYMYESVQVPLTDVQYTGCGDIYRGSITQEILKQEGSEFLHKHIEIVDYSNAICDLYVLDPVQVRYSSFLSGLNVSPAVMVESKFYGGSFKAVD